MPKPLPLSILLATAAVSLGACGGDDALSKAEYVKQANAICRDGNERLEKIAEPQSADDLDEYVDEAKKITTEGVDKLDALAPPENLKDDHEAQVADGRKVIALADDLGKAAKAGDQAELERLSAEGDKIDEASDKRAEKMGLTDCASDS